MSLSKIPENNSVKNRRIPNAFMLFVKEKKKLVLQNCPGETKAMIAAILGQKWRSMSEEEKQVYYDKYNALKKLKDDMPDSKPVVEEKLTENEDTNKRVMNEFSEDSCSNKLDMAADQQPNKFTNKRTVDELTDGTFKACRADSLSDINKPSLSSVLKQKPVKKVRRPPNAFMCFAKEQRPNIDPSYKKDKKCHVNSILGAMWRELSVSEKAKYYHKAKQMLNAYKKTEATSPGEVLKKKARFQKLPKKTVGRPSKKEKAPPKTSTCLRSNEPNGNEKPEIESDSTKPVDKVENTGESTCSSSEPPHVSTEYPNSSCVHQHSSIAKNHCHRMTPSMEAHHSKPCCCQAAVPPNYNNNDHLKHYSGFDSSMSSSCFGAGLLPPMIPPSPFYTPFWMYQQSMAHHMFPFPSHGFPPPFGCNSPYSYSSAYNTGYFNSYSSLYSGRCTGPSSFASHPSNSATTANASNKEDSAEVTENTENCEDELLVVDEGDPNGELGQEN